jgi:hypothetical protein
MKLHVDFFQNHVGSPGTNTPFVIGRLCLAILRFHYPVNLLARGLLEPKGPRYRKCER